MQRQAGFTLIEVLITMVVLAVLAAIAVPNYTDYLRRGKIPEATSGLQGMRTKMELYFQDNRSYPGACVTTAPGAGQIQVPTLLHFTLTCPLANLSPTTYKIVATGGVAGGDQSLAGIVYTIDQSNVRTTTVTAGTTMDKSGYAVGTVNCWVSKKPNLC
jgi:type IV pilus assembly protein PilE